MLLVGDKFSFLYVDIWFDVTKCKFNVKDCSFEMLVVFSPIFVADTKITFVYNFVSPLKSNGGKKSCVQFKATGHVKKQKSYWFFHKK